MNEKQHVLEIVHFDVGPDVKREDVARAAAAMEPRVKTY